MYSGFGSNSGFASGFAFGSVQGVSLDGLSSENALIFKKIVKKDTTTKLKGLDELKKYIEDQDPKSLDQSNQSDLDAVVTKWVCEFPKLVEDSSPKVRLLSVKLMGIIGKTLKKKLSPHIKELIPAWMCGVFDTRREICLAAEEALRQTIPQQKHADTIIYVKKSILEHIEDRLANLFEGSSQISGQKDETEQNESFSRIISSNILLLAHMLDIIPENEFLKVKDTFESLMDTRIWKLVKSEDAKIRSVCYQLISSILKHKQYTNSKLSSIFNITCNSINDIDVSTHPKAWEALISLLHSFSTEINLSSPDSNVSIKKVLIPALSKALKSPNIIEPTYMSLLPLLACNIELSPDFLNSFFSDLWKGIKNETLSKVVVSTYFDCLSYVTTKLMTAGDVQSQEKVTNLLLPKHFFPILHGFFIYEKELSNNISESISLFIMRVDCKIECQMVSSLIWNDLKSFLSKWFIFDCNHDLESSDDLQKLDMNSTIYSRYISFMSEYYTCIGVKRLKESQSDVKFECTHFEAAMQDLLRPTLGELGMKGLLGQLRSISSLSQIWNNLPNLNILAQQKQKEAISLLQNSAISADLSSLLVSIASNPLQSSLNIGKDNQDWVSLLRGFITQSDFAGIKEFIITSMKAAQDSSQQSSDRVPTNSPEFWRCTELDQLAVSLAQENITESNSILAFLIKGYFSNGNDTRSEQDLKLTCSLLSSDCLKSVSKSIFDLVADIDSSIDTKNTNNYSKDQIQAAFHIFEAFLSTQETPNKANLLSNLFKWQLMDLDSSASELEATMSKLSAQLFNTAFPVWLHCGFQNSQEQIAFLNTFVVPIQERLSHSFQNTSSSGPTKLKMLSGAAVRLANLSKNTSKPVLNFLITSLFPGKHINSTLANCLMPYVKIDHYANNPTIIDSKTRKDQFEHMLSISRSSAQTVENASKLHMIQYIIDLFNGIDDLGKFWVSEQTKQITSENIEQSHIVDHQSLINIKILLTYCSILSSPLQPIMNPEKQGISLEFLKNLSSDLSKVIEMLVLPELLKYGETGVLELTRLVLAEFVSTDQRKTDFWLSKPILSQLFEFLDSQLQTERKSLIFNNLWTILSNSFCSMSILDGLHYQKWLLNVKQETLLQSFSKLLSELYKLKPLPNDSSSKSMDVITNDICYCLQAASVLSKYLPCEAEIRKLFEIFTFATKIGFHLQDLKDRSPLLDMYLASLSRYMIHVMLSNRVVSQKLLETHFAQLFDYFEKQLKHVPTNGTELDSISYNSMIFLDTLSSFSNDGGNEDWAHFMNSIGLSNLKAFSNLHQTFESFPKSYLIHFSRSIRYVPAITSQRLSSEEISSLYCTLRLVPDLRSQTSAFLHLLSIIKDHNSHSTTKSSSSSGHVLSEPVEQKIEDVIFDSKLIPIELLDILTDIEAGYHDPIHPDEDHEDEPTSFDQHLFDISSSISTATLLGWRLLLEYTASKDEKEKSDICNWIRQSGMLHLVLPLCFHLIDFHNPPTINEPALEIHLKKNAYNYSESMQLENKATYETLREISAFVVKKLFEAVPVLVRNWWSSLGSVMKKQVDEYASKCISPQLIAKEMNNVSSYRVLPSMLSEQDFKVKAIPSVGEVVASYRKDEVDLIITLKVPSNYPLKAVDVNMTQKAVAETLWRRWLLSMRSLLLTRDGSLLDAVLLWKEYLDRHFEGVECCPICYAIFHISNYSVPNLPCKTCKNKFHSACLYKWFNTSHHNECPLCKTPFN